MLPSPEPESQLITDEKSGRGGANCHTGSRSATLRRGQVGEEVGEGDHRKRCLDGAGPSRVALRTRAKGQPGHLYVGCRDASGTIPHDRMSSTTGAVTLADVALANVCPRTRVTAV